MCDYSLHLKSSRPAKVADRLVTTAFADSTTRGLATIDEPNVAVCLLPGTEVTFDDEVEYNYGFDPLAKIRISERVARFREIDRDRDDVHHDAFEFPSGQVILVHRLCSGQRVTVLQLLAVTELNGTERKIEQAYPSFA